MSDGSDLVAAKAFVRQFVGFSPEVKKIILDKLDELGEFRAVRLNAAGSAELKKQQLLIQIVSLKDRIQQIESQAQSAGERMTAAQKKARMIELSDEGWTPTEIAIRMTADGERMNPGAVRTALWRIKNAK